MARIFRLLILLLLPALSVAQDSIFKFSILSAPDTADIKNFRTKFGYGKPIYEDELYSIFPSCSGEWGGSLKFVNKQTGAKYECESTCPVVIYKMQGQYIVVNSLAHLIGSSEVLEIANPESLKPLVTKKQKNSKKIKMVGSDESRSKVGTRPLLDSIGVITLGAFPYKMELYYIVTDQERTFLAKLIDRKFEVVKLLIDRHITGYSPLVVRNNDNSLQIFFDYDSAPGYFQIIDNEITFFKFK